MKIAALFLLLISTANAETEAQKTAPTVALSGKIFSDLYAPYKNPGTTTFRQFNTSVWLQTDAKLSDTSSAHIEFTGDHFEKSLKGTTGLTLGLREGYATYGKNGWDLRVGRQIIPWGKTDGINPTDYLTAKDYTFLNPDEEMRRIGSTSILTSYTPENGASPATVTLVWTPVAPQSKLLIPDSAISSAFTVNTAQAPAATIANSELALKLSYSKPQWDFSFSAFRGYNHVPELSLTSTGGTILAPTFTITPLFHKVKALGGDFSASFEDYVVRAESAYFWTENNNGENIMLQPRHWDSVVGVEKPLFTDFRIQAQFSARQFYNLQSAESATGANVAIAGANQLLLNYQDSFRPLATLRFGYTAPSQTWDAEVFTAFNFHGQDSLIRPKGSYLWTDSFRTTLGMDRYAGPDNRPLGAMKSYNSIFLEAKYSF